MYKDLVEEIWNLDRCHSSEDMDKAYRLLCEAYPGSRLLHYEANKSVNGWKTPPRWSCKKAEIRDEEGRVVWSREQSLLAVYSYSPKVDAWVSHDELDCHILSDPDRPEAICFHFRNQYRHWEAEWGFCMPHSLRRSLDRSKRYLVSIESELDFNRGFVQSDFEHRGKSKETYLLIGHFDHPAQVNDGLLGCIAAYEVIRRLSKQNTRFSYRAFASVEIIGSSFYLETLSEEGTDVKEAMFLGFSGVDAPQVYQTSYKGNSIFDRIIRNIMMTRRHNSADECITGHRQLIGNDENVFDSAGIEIPTGTLMRYPFRNYHTDFDNIQNYSLSNVEEQIETVLRVIRVIERNFYPKLKKAGLPCLSAEEVGLYISIEMLSGVKLNKSKVAVAIQENLLPEEVSYISENSHRLNQFMQHMCRMSDGSYSLLDIAEKAEMPFGLVLEYALAMSERGVIDLLEDPSGE